MHCHSTFSRLYKAKIHLLALWALVCYTAIFCVVTQCSSQQMAAENSTTFLYLCVCGLTNKPIMNKTLDNNVNCRVLGSKHTSQFSTNQLIVTEFEWAVSKVSSEKNFDRPARLLQVWLVLFSVHTCMYDEFHVPDVLLHCCTCEGYWFKQKQSCKLLMSNFPNYTRQLYKHIHVVHYISLTFMLLLLFS